MGRKAAAAQTAQLQQRLAAAEQRTQQQASQLLQQQQHHVRDAGQRATEKEQLQRQLQEARAKVAELHRQLEEERQRAAAAEERAQAMQAQVEALRAQQRQQSQKEQGQKQQPPQAGFWQAAQPDASPLPQAAVNTLNSALQQQQQHGAASGPAVQLQGQGPHTVPSADRPAAVLGAAAVPPRSPLPARSPLATSSAATATPPPQHLPLQQQQRLHTPLPGWQQHQQSNHLTPQHLQQKQAQPMGTYTPVPAAAPRSAAGTTPAQQHTPHQQQQPPQHWAAPLQQQTHSERAGASAAHRPDTVRPNTTTANPSVLQQHQRAAPPSVSAQPTATPPQAHTHPATTAGNSHHHLAYTPLPQPSSAPHNTSTPTAATPGPSAACMPKLPHGPAETKEAVRAIISKHGSAGVSGPDLVREVLQQGGLCVNPHPSRQQQEQLLHEAVREAVRAALQCLVEDMDVMRMGPGAICSMVDVECPYTRFLPL